MNRADSSMRHGTVHTVHDAVVAIRFAPEWLPIPTSLLISTGGKDAAPAHLRVVAQLDHETVRALRSPAHAPVTIGSKVTTLANAGLDQPLDLAVLHRALDQLAPRVTEPHDLIATGIKVIDVFCPLQAGMRVALYGALKTGTFVFMRELTQRLQGQAQSLSLFTTIATADAAAWRAMRQEWAHAVIVGSEVTSFQILTSGNDHTPFTQATAWDAVIRFSTALAEAHLYPAIDPLHATSRALTADTVGEDHVAIVMNARLHLSELAAADARAEEWRTTSSARLHRARLLRSYLTQPFYVSEAFSGRAGVSIDRHDTLADCAAILAGSHDHRDPQTLYLRGRPPQP
jgi:F0F1-type ATP synthase beta subunit